MNEITFGHENKRHTQRHGAYCDRLQAGRIGCGDTPLEQAVDKLLLHTVAVNSVETVSLLDAAGRVSAEDVRARITQPPFDRSPLDGYAVMHGDIQTASKDTPTGLRVTQCVYAGDVPKSRLNAGEAARIMTGAQIPEGATCVIRQEDVRENDNLVQIFKPLGEYENYCRKGEDALKGQPLIAKGEYLDAAHIAILASQGFAQIGVSDRPKIGIIATGSELIPAGKPLEPGKIYDSNRFYLVSRIRQLGGEVFTDGSAADDPDKLAQAVDGLLSRCDLVITTGGVSVGEHDYMPKVCRMLEADELFHGISMKPGGPAMAFVKDKKLVICLSGNPFAAMATFEMLAKPAVKALCGNSDVLPLRVKSVLRNDFPKPSNGRRLIRARLCGDGVYLPLGGHASGILSSMAGCNCLVDIPAGSGCLNAGDEVEAVLI